MAWNDGVSKEMSDMFGAVIKGLDEETKQAAREVIDEEAQSFYARVKAATPQKTGGLAASFKLTKINRGENWYGYSAEFEGTAPNGTPYQKIANVLEYGRPASAEDPHSAVAGRHFVRVAVQKLKGMDARIAARLASILAKRTN